MTEKRELIGGETIVYDGYFRLADLYSIIEAWVAERGFDKDDKLHEIKVKEEGRYVELDLQPSKQVSEYMKIIAQIRISIKQMTDEEVEIDGKIVKMNKGNIKIIFKASMFTDHEGDWESGPFIQIFQTFFEKFIFKRDIEEFERMAINEVRTLKNEVSAFLNLNKFITPHANVTLNNAKHTTR